MSELILPTDFLSPERTPLDALTQLRIQIVSCQPIVALLDQTPTPMIVLNGLRQLVYANPAFLHTLDTLDLIANHDPLGMRLGELWHCMQADDSPAGCGTSYACRSCHISNTLLEAMKWGEDNDWERIQRLHLGSFEVEMRVKSMYLLGEMVLLCRFGYEPYRSPAPPEPSGVSTDGSDVEGVGGQVVDEPAVTVPEAAAAEAATTELTTIDSATTDRATTDRAATEPTTTEPARAELATP